MTGLAMPNKLVCLDFETFFDTKAGYTLHNPKMTCEQYVREPRFSVICLGHDDGWVSAAKIPEFLSGFDWSKTVVLCHNAHFDGLILSHHYNVHPRGFVCTLAMANEMYPDQRADLEGLAKRFGLSPKTVPYGSMNGANMSEELLEAVGRGAKQDCALTRQIYEKMMSEGFPAGELPIISMTAEMFTNPRLVGDVDMLRSLQQSELDKRARLLGGLGVTTKDLGSSAKLKQLLVDLGVNVEMKRNKKGDLIPAFAATDPFMQELRESEIAIVADLAEARILTKSNIRATRAGRLADTAERGAMPVALRYFGAARSGRWSGFDGSNWQNFPRSGELSRCISGPGGHTLVICDAAQIEYRILCAVSGEQWPLDAFRDEGRDPYCEVATSIFGREITPGTNTSERFIGKKVVLSSGYGISGPTLFKRLRGEGVDLTVELAIRAVATYRERHPHVTRLWKEADAVLYWLNTKRDELWKSGILRTSGGSLMLPNETRLQYRLEWNRGEKQYYRFDRRSGKDGARIWGSALVGECIQALAGVYLRGVLLGIKELTGLKPVCLRHDEAAYLVPDDQAAEIRHVVEKEFRRAPAWLPDVPLAAECWVSKTFTKPPKAKE
jgi:DNA polymerase family A